MALQAGSINNNSSLLTIDTKEFTFTTNTIKDWSWSKSATFTPIDILSRSGSILTYGHSGPIQVNLSLLLAAMSDALKEVTQIAVALHGLLYPTTPGVVPPPSINLTLQGHPLFQDWQCVCTSINIKELGPYAPDGNSMVTEVTMQLTELCITNQSSDTFTSKVSGTAAQKYS